jgi:hypothetical protein
MNVNEIKKRMAEEAWDCHVNYGGEVFYYRPDYEYGVQVVNGDWWELGRVDDGKLSEFVSGETKDELDVALVMLDVLKPMRKQAARESECQCRFAGDIAYAGMCEVHGDGRAA